MSKVIFGEGDEAGESVLRQWETMHRPPDTIPRSGPYGQRSSSGQPTRAGLVVPPPSYSKSGSRRHSVISSPKDNIGQFPLRASVSRESRVSNETRRISEVFLGGKIKQYYSIYVKISFYLISIILQCFTSMNIYIVYYI